jgi:hypothetical protein
MWPFYSCKLSILKRSSSDSNRALAHDHSLMPNLSGSRQHQRLTASHSSLSQELFRSIRAIAKGIVADLGLALPSEANSPSQEESPGSTGPQ